MLRQDELRRALANVKFMLEQDITELGMQTLKRYVDRVLVEDDERMKDASSEV